MISPSISGINRSSTNDWLKFSTVPIMGKFNSETHRFSPSPWLMPRMVPSTVIAYNMLINSLIDKYQEDIVIGLWTFLVTPDDRATGVSSVFGGAEGLEEPSI